MQEIDCLKEIESLRNEISGIDSKILSLAGRRTALAKKIGVLKAEAGLEIIDEKREEAVKQRYRDAALEASVSAECAEALAEVMITEGRRVQQELRK